MRMRLDTLCLQRETWLENWAIIFFQLTYLRDRMFGNLISPNRRLLCLPAACFIIVIIPSFISLANVMWIPNIEGLHSQTAWRCRKNHSHSLFIPSHAHSFLPSPWSLQHRDNSGHSTGLHCYPSCRFTCARHPHIAEKVSGHLLSPHDLEEQDTWEKSLVQDSYLSHFII